MKRALIWSVLLVALTLFAGCTAAENFNEMQKRAKRSECPSNLDAIRTAEKAYHAEWDVFTSAGRHPRPVPTKDAVAWAEGNPAFYALGWTPPGEVRGVYWVEATEDAFKGYCVLDVDGDGVESRYEVNRAEKASMVTSNDVY